MGMNTFDPPEDLNLGESPDMMNCMVYNGLLRKRPGYTQFGSDSLPSAVLGLFSTQNDADATFLYGFHLTGAQKYNAGSGAWDEVVGTALTGTGDNLFSIQNSQSSIVFSQGIDPVKLITFASPLTYAGLNANAPAAKYLERFVNRLFLAHTLESATVKPYRVRRSVNGDHTDWVGVGSGFTDLLEFPYHIRGMKKLASALIVYTWEAIYIGTRTEIPAAPVRFDPLATDVGLLAAHTLRGRNLFHWFLGNDDFYELSFSGVAPIGGPIRDTVFEEISAAQLHRAFSIRVPDTREYITFLCTVGQTIPDKAWVFNYGRRIWYPWSVSGPRSACLHRLDNTSTWDMSGTWDEQIGPWDSSIYGQSFPAMLTGHEDGKVYQWSKQELGDNGTPIPCRWCSKDLTCKDIDKELQDLQVTLNTLVINYQGQGSVAYLNVSFSIDGGITWSSPDVVTLLAGSGEKTVVLDHQTTGNKVRFRLEQTSATTGFVIQSIGVDLECRGQRVST